MRNIKGCNAAEKVRCVGSVMRDLRQMYLSSCAHSTKHSAICCAARHLTRNHVCPAQPDTSAWLIGGSMEAHTGDSACMVMCADCAGACAPFDCWTGSILDGCIFKRSVGDMLLVTIPHNVLHARHVLVCIRWPLDSPSGMQAWLHGLMMWPHDVATC